MMRRLQAAAIALGLAIAATAGAALVADRALPPPLERLASASTVVLDRDGRVLRAYTTREGAWRLHARPGRRSPKATSCPEPRRSPCSLRA